VFRKRGLAAQTRLFLSSTAAFPVRTWSDSQTTGAFPACGVGVQVVVGLQMQEVAGVVGPEKKSWDSVDAYKALSSAPAGQDRAK
jgi:hypothetical protein